MASVSVAPDSVTLHAAGDTARFVARAWTAAGDTVRDVTFVWASGDTSVARVSSTGLAMALRPGRTAITATAPSGAADSATALVSTAGTVARVSVTPDSAALGVPGDTARFGARAWTSAGDSVAGVAFTWTSGNDSVARVDATGLVTARSAGSTVVTATAPGGASGSAFVRVSSLQFGVVPTSVTLRFVGETVRFVATAYGPTGVLTGVTFTWTSSLSSVAQVSQTGLATATGVGTATITATGPGGAAGTASVVVAAPPAAPNLYLVPDGVSLSGVGSSTTLHALDVLTQAPVAGAIAWASLNPAVATVDGAGVVTAVAVGQATISATTDGAPAYALVTVSVPEAAPVTRWTPMPSDTTLRPSGVWGTSATNVYAVGSRLQHFDGSGWSVVAGADTGLTSLWGASASDLFAVKVEYWILGHSAGANVYTGRSNGSTWTWAPASIPGYREYGMGFAMWGASPRGVFVGHNVIPTTLGAVWEFDGVSGWWRASCSAGAACSRTYGLWGTSAANVYAVGSGGTILRRDSSNWSAMASGTTQDLFAVWGTSATDVFAVGAGGVILHFNGTSWSPMASGTTAYLRGVWGASSTNVYAVGAGGTILHYDGSTWTPMASGTTAYLYGIWGTTPTTVFVVGSGGTILRGSP